MKYHVFNSPAFNMGVLNQRVLAKLFVLALVVFATACAHTTPRSDEQEAAGFMLGEFQLTGSVEMKVHANGTQLKVENAANKQCKFAKKEDFQKGCYVVPEDYTARITFKLADQDQAGYFIRSFRICPWAAVDQEADKKPSLPCVLSNPARVEFWVAEGQNILLPMRNGELTLTTQPDSFDLNVTNSFEGIYFYWVEVCPNGAAPGTPCLWADPGSKNDGTGGKG